MDKQQGRSVLIVDDEQSIREMLTIALEMAGFAVNEAKSANDAMEQLFCQVPDIIIIDWMMPKVSGLELCRKIRKYEEFSTIPLIMLTAKGDEDAKVVGLRVCDDFITKPFSPRELVARLNSILRRISKKGIEEPVQFDLLCLDPISQRVSVNNEFVSLSPREYRLLLLFMTNPNRAFTRGQLLDRVWGHNVYVTERTVDVHIRRLRKNLGEHYQKFIETVRGTGYRFCPPIETNNTGVKK